MLKNRPNRMNSDIIIPTNTFLPVLGIHTSTNKIAEEQTDQEASWRFLDPFFVLFPAL
jgi:hypothetical protein